MKICDAWIKAAETQAVCAALTDHGFQALFVGGCVRNALLGVAVSDIDIATDALPDEILRCAKDAGLKAIPTGIEHGTITIVSGGLAHEITTFRSDIETDGRRAKVRFSTDIDEDAARRDFTMNALYADKDGNLLDPLGGLHDLNARKLRFIGDANARIKEDYLRSLRFFRFTAWYGDPNLGVDMDGMAAVASNLDGIEHLSRERVGSELKKLFAAPDPSMAVAAMRSSGLLTTLMEAADDKAVAPLVHFEQELNIAPDPIRRLSVVANAECASSLRLSKADAKKWAMLREEVGSTKSAAHLGYRYNANTASDILLLRAALLETPLQRKQIEDTVKGEQAVFPIKAADLKGVEGRALGVKLRELEQRWIVSEFTLAREDLLN